MGAFIRIPAAAAIASCALALAVAATCTNRSVSRSRDALREVSARSLVRPASVSTPALERLREILARSPEAARCLSGVPPDPSCKAALAPVRGNVRTLLLDQPPDGAASLFMPLVPGPEMNALLDAVTRVPALATDEIREALEHHDLVSASAVCTDAIEHGVSIAQRVRTAFGSAMGLVALRGTRDACVETLGALPPYDRAALSEALQAELAGFPSIAAAAEGDKIVETVRLCGLVASEEEIAALPQHARTVAELERSSPDPLGLGVLDPALRTIWASVACLATRGYVDAFVRARTANDDVERARWERIASWYAWLPGASGTSRTIEGVERGDFSPSRERLEADLL